MTPPAQDQDGHASRPDPFAPGQTPRERAEAARDRAEAGAERARERAQDARERAEAGAERARLTFRRLSGLDRSGPPPPQTLAGQPWHPWTIPNAIGYVRLALIPVFLREAWRAGDGVGRRPATLFAIVAWSDYADGIAARLTGQYSRMGKLLDPLVDRLLVISGVSVCWRFKLLPRPALGLLVTREVFTMGLVRWGMRRELDLEVNWLGRAGVWPVMTALYAAMIGARRIAHVALLTGLPLMLAATGRYLRDARAALRERRRLRRAPSS